MSSPVEQIKERLAIEDVIGSYIKLQKAGANFKAICPFHQEKAPSFYVSPSRGIWHCFGCNRGGDIFEFVKQIEGVEFPEALRILADRAGVTITYQDKRVRNERMQLFDLLKDAAVFYQKNLIKNKAALSYLWKRGLKSETLKKFNIGFAPPEERGWRNIFNYLKNRGYTSSQIEKAGLVVKKQKGGGISEESYYDRFRNRIIFPLKDGSGRIVGFSGRIFNDGNPETAKYINTPQTILYDKSKILYGFDLAKTEIRKKDSCILVEGQMDVLMAHQAGTINTVAVSGTALTDQHLNLIKRLTNNLIMAFDSDEAGIEAAKRSIDLALLNGFEVRAISLPKGKDPADLILEEPEKWLKRVEKTNHIIDFYLNVLKEKYGSSDCRQFKLSVEKNVLPYVALMQSEIDKDHWVSKIADIINVRKEAILKQLEKVSTEKLTVSSVPASSSFISNSIDKSRQMILIERLLGLSLWKGWEEGAEAPYPKEIKKIIFEYSKKQKKDYLNRLSLEAELYYQNSDNLDKEVESLIKELKKENLKHKLQRLSEEIKECEDKKDEKKLQKKLTDFEKLSRQLAEI